MTFEVAYPFLWILLIIGVAFVVTFFGYRRANFDRPYGILLPSLRFLSLAILGFLLLNPSLEYTESIEERPVLFWLQDESESITASKDSSAYRSEYFEWKRKAIERLEDKFDVVSYAFDKKVRTASDSFHGAASNPSQALNEIEERAAGRNSAGIILATDGIANYGMPLQASKKSTIPIHTLTLGDTSQYSDIEVVKVVNNRIAYTENTTPIRLEIQSKNNGITQVKVDLFANEERIESRNVQLNKGLALALFEVGSDSAGVVTYELKVRPFEGERNVLNNSCRARIEYIKKKRSIRFVYGGPNPDLAAFRLPLLEDESNLVELIPISDWKAEMAGDIVVFHGVNPEGEVIETLEASNAHVLFFSTPAHPYADWSTRFEWFDNAPMMDRFVETTLEPNPLFSGFEVNDEWLNRIEQFPPIYAEIHGEEEWSLWNPIFTANVRGVETKAPLIALSEKDGSRYTWVNGEGWWRIRANSYASYNSHEPFDQFVTSLFRWLGTQPGSDRLRVDFPDILVENEQVQFSVIPRNASQEFQSGAEINLLIRDRSGDIVYNQTLSEESGRRYVTQLKGLPQGTYRYEVTSIFGDDTQVERGILYVEAQSLEQRNTRARYDVLYALSANSQGQSSLYSEKDAFIESLLQLDAQIILHENRTSVPLIYSWWIYLLLLLLFTAEWALRKREGRV